MGLLIITEILLIKNFEKLQGKYDNLQYREIKIFFIYTISPLPIHICEAAS